MSCTTLTRTLKPLYFSPFYEPQSTCCSCWRDGRSRRGNDQDAGEAQISIEQTDLACFRPFSWQNLALQRPATRSEGTHQRCVQRDRYRTFQRGRKHFARVRSNCGENGLRGGG